MDDNLILKKVETIVLFIFVKVIESYFTLLYATKQKNLVYCSFLPSFQTEADTF